MTEDYFGIYWSTVIDTFFKSVEDICNSYRYSPIYNNIMDENVHQYERNVVAEVDIVIKYGILQIIWDKIKIYNHNGSFLSEQTQSFSERLLELSQLTEQECANMCFNCGVTPAFTKENQRGGFSTLCNLCHCENNIYKSRGSV
jgi:hypothetical protein